jgi:hypothetical protein
MSRLAGALVIVHRPHGYRMLRWLAWRCSRRANTSNILPQRDNITFGQRFEEDRYWRVVEIACLLPDLQLLPDGDLTEVW